MPREKLPVITGLILAAVTGLTVLARFWGWPHVAVWALQGAVAGGAMVFVASAVPGTLSLGKRQVGNLIALSLSVGMAVAAVAAFNYFGGRL